MVMGIAGTASQNLERTVITVKKLIALLLAVAFVCASAVGCGDTKPTNTGKGGTTPPPAAPKDK